MRRHTFLSILAYSLFFTSPLQAQSDEEENEPFEENSEEAIAYEDLPKSVKRAFQSSEYEGMGREGVEKLETDKGTLYEIELKKKEEQILEIYYDKNGELIHRGTEEEENEEEEEDDED